MVSNQTVAAWTKT